MTDRSAIAVPGARLPATAVMLVLPVCGMAIGLAVDCGVTPPALLAALCADSSGGLGATIGFLVAVLPSSYAMMAAAAVLATAINAAGAGQVRRTAASRIATATASVIAMLAGMFAGGWLAPDAAALFGAGPGFGPLVAGMVAGMIVASAGVAAIARAINAATARAGRPVQYIMYQ
jgi:hypothetical protein